MKGYNKKPQYDLRRAPVQAVADLCRLYHPYGSIGSSSTYCLGVYEEGRVVAAYLWQPPPPGAARKVCPEAPYGVLALSRMVAVPRGDRALRHVSVPLRWMMHNVLDRGRWPVLITYSDESVGHTGYVYRCSGWTPTDRNSRPVYTGAAGERRSVYNNGVSSQADLNRHGSAWIQRWEHRACPPGQTAEHIKQAGWVRTPVPGKQYRSGNQAYTWVQAKSGTTTPSSAVPSADQ